MPICIAGGNAGKRAAETLFIFLGADGKTFRWWVKKGDGREMKEVNQAHGFTSAHQSREK